MGAKQNHSCSAGWWRPFLSSQLILFLFSIFFFACWRMFLHVLYHNDHCRVLLLRLSLENHNLRLFFLMCRCTFCLRSVSRAGGLRVNYFCVGLMEHNTSSGILSHSNASCCPLTRVTPAIIFLFCSQHSNNPGVLSRQFCMDQLVFCRRDEWTKRIQVEIIRWIVLKRAAF